MREALFLSIIEVIQRPCQAGENAFIVGVQGYRDQRLMELGNKGNIERQISCLVGTEE